MRRAFRFRLRIIAGCLLALALFIILRLYFVQVIHGSDYALRAQRQYVSSSQELYDRGTIYFTRRDGTLISAATLETGFLIAIDPEDLKDPGTVYSEINQVTPIDPTGYWKSAAHTNDPYEVIAHHVSDKDGQAVAALNIPGVLVERERWRIYPGGTEGAPILGFVGYDNNNNYVGRAGLEQDYESTLERSSTGLFGNFFAELFANISNTVVDARSAKQGDVITSIEPMVEERLDQDLKAVNDKYHSTETGGIIMDPHTGEIIAIDSYPTFDPNDIANANPNYLGDPLVQHEYEFGSIQKSLTMASGLDSGAITPDETYNDTGCIHPNNTTVCNYDLRARGVIPMIQILDQSLNVGSSFIAGQMGHAVQRKYDLQLGLGAKSGVDLPGELQGNTRNLYTTEDVNFDNASFGQGLAVTPIEMIRAVGALANGGEIVTPHLGTAVQFETGITRPLTYAGPVRVFSTQTATEVTKMLATVFPPDAKIAMAADPTLQMPKVAVAAKTGTAQVVNVQTGTYYKNIYFHSFYGYFPANNPKFIILLYTNRPQGVQYASGTLTGTFMDLTNFLISYYDIPPDGSLASNN